MSVAIDVEKAHRQYAVKYALNSREGVASLLRDMHVLRERRLHAGDYAASDILIDLQTAIDRARLTGRQREALYWVYERDMTQKDAGAAMGVGQDVVNEHISVANGKIADIFDAWGYGIIEIKHNEELRAIEV